MEEKYSVQLSHEYNTTPQSIFNFFKNGTVFRLTGADEVKFDFCERGIFKLTFTGRGIIEGAIVEIISGKKIILRWNVSGFGKPNERDTKVCFSFSGEAKTLLKIVHREIMFKEAAEAKQKAWTEILFELEKEILTNP